MCDSNVEVPCVILYHSDNRIVKYIDNLDTSNCKYKLSSYIVKVKVKDGYLLYSGLTGSLILVHDFEASRSTLINEHFLLPDFLQEKEFVDESRKKDQQQPFKVCACLDYWIITTTKCNARCFYCFEAGYKHYTMTHETAIQTANFIVNNYSGTPVILHWYGGEPLVNHQVIDIICDILSENNVKFVSEITTNGYLFAESLLEHALLKWNLVKVIVTIDGTEDIYNRAKNYKQNQGENAYGKVMKNLNNLINHDVNTVIRTNIGEFNVANAPKLYNILAELYLKKNNVDIYPHIISNPPNGGIIMSGKLRRKIYETIRLIKSTWKKSRNKDSFMVMPGYTDGRGLEFTTEKLVVKPNGEFAIHPDLFEEDHFGNVYEGFKVNENRLAQYIEKKEEGLLCKNCPIYPTCFKRLISFNEEVCFSADLEKCISTTKKNMQFIYDKYQDSIRKT